MNDPIAASVRQRLLNLSRDRGDDFQLMLTHFAIERLLYRLSQSADGNRFVLKGAMLFNLWAGRLHRPTRDLDLSGRGEPSPTKLHTLFQELCSQTTSADGLIFDPNSVQIMPIREQQGYEGQRVHLVAYLTSARIPLQIDIGFGDAVTPGPIVVDYPTLLDFSTPRLRTYPKETVIAEKTQALVALGMANSRMKDFYDLWFLAETFDFGGETLADALNATFARRSTRMPAEPPTGLTDRFYNHPQKQQQWQAFLSRNEIDLGGITLAQVIDRLNRFLMPALNSARTLKPLFAVWKNDAWHDD